MRRAPAFLAAILLATAAAGAGDEADPPHPLFTSGKEEWMELRGGFEAGVRGVTGKDGRYEQDVNLDGGFRLLSADLAGSSLQEGLWADAFSLSLRGVGDPNRLAEFRISKEDAYDFRLFANRQAYIYKATADPHPFDTERDMVGMSLSVNLSKDFLVRYSDDRMMRSGDALLEMRYRDEQGFPAPTVIDYEGHFRSAGFDGTSGPLRFGGTWSWNDAQDDSLRTLDAPAANPGDTGRYRNVSDSRGHAATGRAGWKLPGGWIDVSVSGGWHDAETDSSVVGIEAITSTTAPGTGFYDLRARTEANSRGWFGRGEVLLLPHADWEVLGRHEVRSDGVVGDAETYVRDVPPPFPPGGTYTAAPESTRSDADLARTGAEGRWRASRQWRLRAGLEQVRERITSKEVDTAKTRDRSWSPTTVAATAGVDWTPNERFDASILGRGARARNAATALSLDEGNSLSVRLRTKRPDGWHSTAFARVKRRSEDSTDSLSHYDSYGLSMGNVGWDHSMELTVSREDLRTASDTSFVVDASSNPAHTPHRIRFDEKVTAVTLDLSQVLWGPLRGFGSVRWAGGNGDAPYAQSDVTLGLGWTFAKGAELRIDGRRVAYDEGDRSVDDYAAKILTLSVAYEF